MAPMMIKSGSSRFAKLMLGASCFLFVGACAHKAPPVVQAPIVTSAKVEALPKLVIASPLVNVSDEIATACKLRFNDADTAPKFDFDRSDLGQDDNDILSQVAKCVTTGPLAGRSLDLVGRADPRGEQAYNTTLGHKRASSVSQYLTSVGVDASKLVSTSRGEGDATGTDESGWQRDRRVDILLH